jgi:hypothetical protein
VDPYSSPDTPPAHESELLRRHHRDAVILRVLIPLKFALLFIGIFFGMDSGSDDPSDEAVNLVPLIIFSTLAIASIVSWIALALLKPWAAWLYTLSYFGIILSGFILLENSPQKSKFENLMDWITIGVSFSIMIIAHFSCALRQREDTP